MGLSKPCKLWLGSTTAGYGTRTIKRKLHYVHVLALIEKTGEQPNGRFALHSCDVRNCYEPEHLRWGTAKDNAQDMISRDRQYKQPRFFEESDIIHIRSANALGASQRSLARHYECAQGTIGDIVHRRTYKEVL